MLEWFRSTFTKANLITNYGICPFVQNTSKIKSSNHEPIGIILPSISLEEKLTKITIYNVSGLQNNKKKSKFRSSVGLRLTVHKDLYHTISENPL